MEGAESGMDAETPALLKKTNDVGSGVLGRFRENASDLVAKMRAGFAPIHIYTATLGTCCVGCAVSACWCRCVCSAWSYLRAAICRLCAHRRLCEPRRELRF